MTKKMFWFNHAMVFLTSCCFVLALYHRDWLAACIDSFCVLAWFAMCSSDNEGDTL